MASLTLPLMARLNGEAKIFGQCLACRSKMLFQEEVYDFACGGRLGISCACRRCLLVETEDNPQTEKDVDGRMDRPYQRQVFRWKMLAWQWQTGRTLAGYRRGA